MAWLGKVSLGNFGDIAGAVTKLSESVKNIERNFDSALGFDDKEKDHDDAQSSTGDRNSILDPVFAFVTQRDAPKDPSESDLQETKTDSVVVEKADALHLEPNTAELGDDANLHSSDESNIPSKIDEVAPSEAAIQTSDRKTAAPIDTNDEKTNAALPSDNKTIEELPVLDREISQAANDPEERSEEPSNDEEGKAIHSTTAEKSEEQDISSQEKQEVTESDPSCAELEVDQIRELSSEVLPAPLASTTDSISPTATIIGDVSRSHVQDYQETVANDSSTQIVDSPIPRDSHAVSEDENSEMEILKQQVKMLEHALQGAAHQSKVKADELSRLSLENDNLRSSLEEMKRKSSEAELEALREEFQQRINASERKVYALTKERDMLRREQSRRDSSILLKEKDEIIKQVMAEGEELSKKQAAQEAQMRKLRAQIRELEEEKQRIKSKLQVEEATVESIRRDKAATEKALQEAVERTQVELAVQKEFYTNALNEAKEAEARAEARADTEARLQLERRIREADEREAAIVQNLEELRQTLSRTEQQAAFREDMLRRDVEDLEQRCQAAERRYEELVASVPESTRPLLRQIDAMRETMGARSEAWSGVERSLNSRLQEAEAKSAAAQERERAINERLTQTLSRMAVLEAQVSCLKAEQSQLTRTLEKERQRASENRQEYLAAVEAAATHEGHAKQIEEDLKELRSRFKRELAEERTMRELLQKELEQEKQKTMKRDSAVGNGSWPVSDKINTLRGQAPPENSPSRSLRRLSSASTGSLEESYFLQVSLDSSADQTVIERGNSYSGLSPRTGKGIFPNASVQQLETLLSQKEGELALYTSRLASLESTRNALAEELVKATTQCEQFRAEVASVPGLRAELESLRKRHTSALELMGERDEQVEELKADLADVKQMYREQIDMLVNQIEQLTIAVGRSP